MGNCQAVDATTVIIHHPTVLGKNKVDIIYYSVSARHVMSLNSGYFVALIVTPHATQPQGKHLKLLRPDDMLVLGQVYRLVSVQDVLKEFAAKKCVKLAKLLEDGGIVIDKNKLRIISGLINTNQKPGNCHLAKDGQRSVHCQGNGSSNNGRRMGKNHSRGGQWKPALQSISELGS